MNKAASYFLAGLTTSFGYVPEKIMESLIPEEYWRKSGVLKGVHDIFHSFSTIDELFENGKFNYRRLERDEFYDDGVDPTLTLRKTAVNLTLDQALGIYLWSQLVNPPLILYPFLQATTLMRGAWDVMYVGSCIVRRAKERTAPHSMKTAKRIECVEYYMETGRNYMKFATETIDYVNFLYPDRMSNSLKKIRENSRKPEQDPDGRDMPLNQLPHVCKDVLVGEAELAGEFMARMYERWRQSAKKANDMGMGGMLSQLKGEFTRKRQRMEKHPENKSAEMRQIP